MRYQKYFQDGHYVVGSIAMSRSRIIEVILIKYIQDSNDIGEEDNPFSNSVPHKQ